MNGGNEVEYHPWPLEGQANCLRGFCRWALNCLGIQYFARYCCACGSNVCNHCNRAVEAPKPDIRGYHENIGLYHNQQHLLCSSCLPCLDIAVLFRTNSNRSDRCGRCNAAESSDTPKRHCAHKQDGACVAHVLPTGTIMREYCGH